MGGWYAEPAIHAFESDGVANPLLLENNEVIENRGVIGVL